MPVDSEIYFQQTGKKLLSIIRKHFHLEGKNEGIRFRERVDPDDVSSFYTEYMARIRPSKLRPEKILPSPDPTKLRALYLGTPSAKILLNNLVQHSLYVDQILISDPFQSILILDPSRSVLENPGIWLEVVINKAIGLCAITDWIEADIVRIIPYPFYYYRDVLFQSADQWEARGIHITHSQRVEIEEEFIVEFLISHDQSQWDDILKSIDAIGRPMTEDDYNYFKNKAIKYGEQYPTRFRITDTILDTIESRQGYPSKIISLGGGIPIHLAPEIAGLTGSFMLFQNKRSYDILVQNFGRSSQSSFEEISLAFQNLDFPFLHNVPIEAALYARQQQYLSRFRSYLREVWSLRFNDTSRSSLDAAILSFRDRLSTEYSILQDEWKEIRTDLRIGAIKRGALTGASMLVAGTLNWTVGAAGVLGSLASAIKEYRELAQRVNIAKRNPLAVFVDLARRDK